MKKRIGILTSGGDCPGLNCVIRAVVSHATRTYDWEVVGIPYATQGLLERKTVPLSIHGWDLRGIDPLLSMGGTILGSISKGDTLAHANKILAGYQAIAIDALIAISGNGSLNIIHQLAVLGHWNLIAIPKTIDHDVAFTERSIGFDTALNTIVDAINRLIFTAASHDRVMIIEVMGRSTGHLALYSGIAGGADVILIPEVPYTIRGICHHLTELRDRWQKKFAIIVVAEGISTCLEDANNPSISTNTKYGQGQYIAEKIANCSHHLIDTRVSVLGHIQRGGIPSALDRLTASMFGKVAVDLIAQNKYDQMLAWQNGKVVTFPIQDVIAKNPSLVNPQGDLVQTARSLGIYIGE
ncbi:ATP-dependent 6-phosphofructokinase [Aphanizomenon flos-aquae NRERC-008]|jgi:6-phosphofructokinase 1|uniref:ATP-dependent 6-phosphofructokinase n=1 Tax=Aphanizomenon flos-aquae FACHB-1249 TaxID=2692889 RepID=A0ABR8ITJ3_APHFL|nr:MULTISPECIES: ATP-dependent 6-phosphofructokinase [Aphanizomenon]MBD2391401.1 ATP-dependent 6-phosphofructokinase [Aphanizomenon flos-aquae FACHB-1171]MBD2557750.1 ATP-dependent 6-phosphofructokinase [Aphanizomenon flos-aquae FACHB-1290]MBD2632390.1 ATP-dependent 6-phosphofructokinase [Aphanizomenon sp. FACHB-1399]MBD2643551.1 ATP-dependent 6-phosphofructokinase [Aphanizomenon sp. FACHB-1401]MBD2658609.1 ATP-dependent 6-phosphofructokinase [Aphanizomenon flos-aquae FACHB-1265]